MSGTGNTDDLEVLLASFVEEVKPFCAGIRRGVNGVFALRRDSQAIAEARASLETIASAATVFDLPAAQQLAELARIVDEAFSAAERGGVPDESRAPMLTMVHDLEAQLDGLLTGDRRGRDSTKWSSDSGRNSSRGRPVAAIAPSIAAGSPSTSSNTSIAGYHSMCSGSKRRGCIARPWTSWEVHG